MMTRLTRLARLDRGPATGPSTRSTRSRRMLWMSFGLLYMIPLVGDTVHYPRGKAVLGWVGLAAFAGTYVGLMLGMRSWAEPIRRVTWVLLGVFTVLSIVLPVIVDQTWVGTSIFLAIVMAIGLPMRWAPAGVIGASLLMVLHGLVLGLQAGHTATMTVTTASIGVVMLSFRNARMLVHQLQEARSEVARLAATEERLRIARDLHDLLGHSLSLIVLKSELAKRLSERDAVKAAKEVEDIESVARSALADVRAAVSGYRRRSLAEEIDGARAVLSAAGVRTTVRTAGTPLPEAVDGLLGWAVREGVTNVVRHAQAGECEIVIGREDDTAVLRLSDDGIGAPAADGTPTMNGTGTAGSGARDGAAGGNGLAGLAERITGAGGSFVAGPLPGGGFRLTVRAPLDLSRLSSRT